MDGDSSSYDAYCDHLFKGPVFPEICRIAPGSDECYSGNIQSAAVQIGNGESKKPKELVDPLVLERAGHERGA